MDTLEKNKATVRYFNNEFFESGNEDVFDEIVDPHMVYHAHPQGIPEGRESFWNFIQHVLKPSLSNIKVDIKDMVAEGDKVVTLKAYTGTLKHDINKGEHADNEIEVVVMEIIRLENGKFVEYWNLTDSEDAGMKTLMEENYIY